MLVSQENKNEISAPQVAQADHLRVFNDILKYIKYNKNKSVYLCVVFFFTFL